MHSIEIDGVNYPLKRTFFGKFAVNTYLETHEKLPDGSPATIQHYLNEIYGICIQYAQLSKKEGDQAEESMALFRKINDSAVMYLLWSLMFTKENKHALTFDKYVDITFNINDQYKIHDLITIIVNVFIGDSKTSNDSGSQDQAEVKKK